MDKERIRAVYRRYGFSEEQVSYSGVMVFTIKAGHFHNADIIPIDEAADVERVFSDFKNSGFACKIRKYNSVTEIERQLFLGFFSAESTKLRLKKEYEKFSKSITDLYAANVGYSYIKVKYHLNDKVGEKDVIQEIVSRISSERPTLFLIEAAAGFGKTCTAYELMREFVGSFDWKVPLFTEFSRNRQAKIFRYVLLDEIDRSFPLLSSSLVTAEIRRGNVPLILDGFDELLRSKVDDGFETVEPMLETIGELLHERAKVILTTRRTAILSGDDFHEWILSHENDFDVVRVRLSEPSVADWLPFNRLEALKNKRVPVDKLSNPVLLSYLRNIDDERFETSIENADLIVDKYFEVMFDREKERQQLHMRGDQQYSILASIAADMMQHNYTSESRDYIIDFMVSEHEDLLDSIRKLYPADERPTKDELATKLASHAFLDKSVDDEERVGFVNEFIMGTFCGKVISDDTSGDWTCDERFVEPSVVAFVSRMMETRVGLYRALQFLLNFVTPSERIKYALMLIGGVDYEISGVTIEKLDIYDCVLGERKISDAVFFSCDFHGVVFLVEGMENVSFIDCNFYGCRSEGVQARAESIIHPGCSFDLGSIFMKPGLVDDSPGGGVNVRDQLCEAHVLRTFIPVGSQLVHKHRPLKVLLTKTGEFNNYECFSAVNRLRKKQIIFDGRSNGIIELNMEKITEARAIVGLE